MPIINPTEDQFSNWMAQYYPPQQPSRRLSDLALSPQDQAALMADLQQTQDPENAAIMQQMAQQQAMPPPQAPMVRGNTLSALAQPQAMNTIQSSSGNVIDLNYAAPGGSGIAPDGRRTSYDPHVDGPRELSRKQLRDGTIEVIRQYPAQDGFGRQSTKLVREIEMPAYLNPVVKQQMDFQLKQAQLQKAQAEAQDLMGMPVGGGMQSGGGMTAGQASQKFLERRYGKAPEGERWKSDGTLEIIPGGKAEAKENKEKLLVEGVKKQVGTVVGKVDEALPQVSNWTAGLGSLLEKIPGTPARDLAGSVDTIKANIGFKELADMRAASPTGGALGQVAVKELEFLQAAIAALDTGQSPAVLRRNLNQVKTHYQNWAKIMDQHYKTNGGATKSPTQPAKQVVSSGTFNGRRVVKYSDGSIDYAD